MIVEVDLQAMPIICAAYHADGLVSDRREPTADGGVSERVRCGACNARGALVVVQIECRFGDEGFGSHEIKYVRAS